MTKTERIQIIREKLRNCDPWILRGLHAIYQRQTEEEQAAERTIEHNGIGFSGIDGDILSSFAERMIQRGYVKEHAPHYNLGMFFSPKQEAILRNRMPKYAGQLDKISQGRV